MMAKVQKLSELSQSFSFTEYDFYEHYRRAFENTMLGKMKKMLPLHEMAENFGLVSKRRSPKRGPKPYFTPEGKVALAFLKMYTQTSAPKLLYIFFGIHTANAVLLAERLMEQQYAEAA